MRVRVRAARRDVRGRGGDAVGGEPEVAQLDVAARADEDILRLEIAVEHLVRARARMRARMRARARLMADGWYPWLRFGLGSRRKG